MSNETSAGVEIPRYRCHKIVRAAKITAIQFRDDRDGERLMLGEIGGSIDVSYEWLGKHSPVGTVSLVGGYYVVYDDGYKSFSPAKAFEDGYTRI